MEETAEQPQNSHDILEKEKGKAAHLAPWQFKKGQSGNPSGRKAGESMKEFAKRYLACQTDEEKLEFMEGLSKDIIWKMAEGNPKNESDIAIKELPIIQVAKEILDKNAIDTSTGDNSQG